MIFEVSSLTDIDFVLLVGNYNYLLTGAKEEIDPRLKDKGYSPEALALLKQQARTHHNAVTSCGLRFTRHLSNYKFPLMNYVSTAFQNYERGVLPYQGALADQPAQIIEIFNVISAINSEHEQRRLAEFEKKQKAMNGRR